MDNQSVKSELVSIDQLNESEILRWQQIRQQVPSLSSPFFSNYFVRSVNEIRPATKVVVIERENQIIGFWPLELFGKKGLPVAHAVNEISGLVFAGNQRLDLVSILKSVGLSRWKFDCVPSEQISFQTFKLQTHQYHWICLDGGFQMYCDELKSQGSRQAEYCKRKWRKLEREKGPLRFQWQTEDLRHFTALIQWKRQQYSQTGTTDVLGIPWVENLLKDLQTNPSGKSQGVISGLFLGDQPIALNYGLFEDQILAIWFPAYDPSLAAYSPGSLLFFRLLEEAAKRGVTRIELGQGEERYKLSFGNRKLSTWEGIVSGNPLTTYLQTTQSKFRIWAENSNWGKMPLRTIRNIKSRLWRNEI